MKQQSLLYKYAYNKCDESEKQIVRNELMSDFKMCFEVVDLMKNRAESEIYNQVEIEEKRTGSSLMGRFFEAHRPKTSQKPVDMAVEVVMSSSMECGAREVVDNNIVTKSLVDVLNEYFNA